MELLVVALVLFVVAGLLGLIASIAKEVAGHSQYKKFLKLGNMSGMSLAQIVSQVGAPNSITQFPDGEKLCQWAGTDFAIGLMFDSRDICIRLAHQDHF
jgi:hypothetical protein